MAPLVIASLMAVGLAAPRPAAAQAAVGFQAGAAVDPEQVFGGVFYQTADLGRGIRLRGGIDGATGDGLRIATINADLIYGYPLNSGWTIIAGGGPAVVVTRWADYDDLRDTGLGFHSIVGFGHDNGFFVEARFGSLNAQRLKLGVGWAIVLD
jgi:hypothetical protein